MSWCWNAPPRRLSRCPSWSASRWKAASRSGSRSRPAPVADRRGSMSTKVRRPDAGDGVFILGLVGRAGSGKTTVSQALEADGARVLLADQLGHEVTDRDPEVRAALIAEHGPAVYLADGTLDRARVAAKVFAEPRAGAGLNEAVRPRIVAAIRPPIVGVLRDGRRRG